MWEDRSITTTSLIEMEPTKQPRLSYFEEVF